MLEDRQKALARPALPWQQGTPTHSTILQHTRVQLCTSASGPHPHIKLAGPGAAEASPLQTNLASDLFSQNLTHICKPYWPFATKCTNVVWNHKKKKSTSLIDCYLIIASALNIQGVEEITRSLFIAFSYMKSNSYTSRRQMQSFNDVLYSNKTPEQT